MTTSTDSSDSEKPTETSTVSKFEVYKKGSKYSVYLQNRLIIITDQLQIVRKYLVLNETRDSS